MKNRRDDAVEYFVEQLKDGRLEYRDGEIWKLWEPRRNWLPNHIRLDKPATNGYYMLRQKRSGIVYRTMSHRVIYTFLRGKIDVDMEVNHIDCNPANNKIENLELVDKIGNYDHAIKMGRIRKSTDHYNCKLTDDNVREIRHLYKDAGMLQAEIADMFGVQHTLISRIVNGKRRSNVPDN